MNQMASLKDEKMIMEHAFLHVSEFLKSAGDIQRILCCQDHFSIETEIHQLKKQNVSVKLISDCYICSGKIVSMPVKKYIQKCTALPFLCQHASQWFGEISDMLPQNLCDTVDSSPEMIPRDTELVDTFKRE